MKFDELLSEYELQLSSINRRYEYSNENKDCKFTKEFLNGCKVGLFKMFQEMKNYCEDYRPTTRIPTQEECIKFKYVTTNDNNIATEWPLCGIIEYREQVVPVYDDDYGQQEFIVLDGEVYSGGAYNMMCDYDFYYLIDRYVDKIDD